MDSSHNQPNKADRGITSGADVGEKQKAVFCLRASESICWPLLETIL